MKIDVLNLKGEKIEQIDIRDDIFGFEPKEEALKQYIRVYQANQRQGTSSTKTRSEVSGGGAKPFRQKGTGRARAGSTRGPIWVHGGVAHGPKMKSWNLSLPKSLKEAALKSVLSMKTKDKNLIVIDNVEMEKPGTKEFSQALEKLKVGNKVSIVWFGEVQNLIKSARNIPGIHLVNVKSLGAYDVIRSPFVIFLKEAILEIQERIKK